MKKLNTHGFKMHGIKKVAGMTKDLAPYGAWHVAIFYNLQRGEVWGNDLYGSTFCRAEDGSYAIADVHKPITMQELADMIAYSI